jgi:hypothetical protein
VHLAFAAIAAHLSYLGAYARLKGDHPEPIFEGAHLCRTTLQASAEAAAGRVAVDHAVHAKTTRLKELRLAKAAADAVTSKQR